MPQDNSIFIMDLGDNSPLTNPTCSNCKAHLTTIEARLISGGQPGSEPARKIHKLIYYCRFCQHILGFSSY